jgi:phospholipid/cholesterol/gamma-HCH transport system substrate-binding protein
MRRARGIAALDPVRFGAATLLLAAVLVYAGFSKAVPFRDHFEVSAVFQQATAVREGTPVRIAGVQVGEVAGVEREPGTDAARVRLRIEEAGLPVHRDATAKIRPRIFLEGNFFVDLKPGTPTAPAMRDGDTIPITRTATPVQFDQVLTALQSDTRADLQEVLTSYGSALTRRPTAADDAGQDPMVQGLTAAQALNRAFDDGPAALRGTAVANTALQGTRPDDLSRLVRGLRGTVEGLGRDEGALRGLVSGFRRTVDAFAAADADLRATVAELPGTLQGADTAFAGLRAALPGTRALSRDSLAFVRETPATIAAARPWVAQTRRLLGPAELQGLARDLRPATASLSRVVDRSTPLLAQADLLARCTTEVLLPTGNTVIDEGPLSTGTANYKAFLSSLVGFNGEGQNFDGNGQVTRLIVGGGANTFSTGPVRGEKLFGNAIRKPLGTRPALPAARPPYRPDAPCKDQTPPDLNGPA